MRKCSFAKVVGQVAILLWPVASFAQPLTLSEGLTPILRNAAFTEGLSQWRSPFGTQAKVVEKGWEGHPALEIAAARGEARQVSQKPVGIEHELRPNDKLHLEAWMRCEEEEKACLFISRECIVEGRNTYRLYRQFAGTSGQWQFVSLEVMVDDAFLESLLSVHLGFRGEEGMAKSFSVAGVRAWVERESIPAPAPLDLSRLGQLFDNPDFTQGAEATVSQWQCGPGITAARLSGETGGQTTVLLQPVAGASSRTFLQYLQGLESFVRTGDRLHLEMKVKSDAPGSAQLVLDLGYASGDTIRWTGTGTACPGDGAWHTVSLDWSVSDAQLPPTPKLSAIRAGLRLDGKSAAPVFVASARAWLAASGL